MSKKIYLSPSNQPSNIYCVGDTNEKVQMEDIAKRVKAILDAEYDCETVMATISLSIGSDGRPKEAKTKGCDVYLAIHSNAGGAGKTSGAVAFYHPSNSNGKALATNIVKELNAICPVKSNRSTSVTSGMNAFNGSGYGEIRTPNQYGLITVLAETDFHDNPQAAQWIINSKDAIARAYVVAIVNTFNIAKKQVPPVTLPPATPPRYYRVQLGAFSVKANADAFLAKVKAAGFTDAFIKYGE